MDINEENRILKNRCRILTHGLICQSCKMECENRERDFGDWSGIDIGEEESEDVDKA